MRERTSEWMKEQERRKTMLDILKIYRNLTSDVNKNSTLKAMAGVRVRTSGVARGAGVAAAPH